MMLAIGIIFFVTGLICIWIGVEMLVRAERELEEAQVERQAAERLWQKVRQKRR
jgi:hypothetical protein